MLRRTGVLFLVACGSGGAPEGSEPARAPSVATTTRANDGPSPTGKWVSPSCGARTYPRELELLVDGRFVSRDLVSPCPAGVSCVWSGIVERSGRFTVTEARIALVVEKGEAARGGQALPETLVVEGGAPVEEAGGARCVYARL
jgi:hypothetical protein